MKNSNHSQNPAVHRRSGCFLAVGMLAVVVSASAPAQTFTTLHSFTGGEGGGPLAGLVISGNTLYGTTYAGGVFAVSTDGTGFTTLHHFTGSDGAFPYAGLISLGNTLYGTAAGGGSSSNGTVFSLAFVPQLTITPSGTNVILSWPTNVAGFDYAGYTLQAAPAIAGTFTNLPAAANPYTNPIVGKHQFYRLIQ